MMYVLSQTKPELFVIESLSEGELDKNRSEAAALQQTLELLGKKPIVKNPQNYDDFCTHMEEFVESRHRFLHLSMHGDSGKLLLSNGDSIDADDLCELCRGKVGNRRISFSSCQTTTKIFSQRLIPDLGLYSIIGHERSVDFSDANMFWQILYYRLAKVSPERITHKLLKDNIRKARAITNIDIHYYSRSKRHPSGVTDDIMKSRRKSPAM